MGKYDLMTRDLARKAGEDVAGAVYRTIALHDDLDGKLMIALMASGQTLAITSAILAQKMQFERDKLGAAAIADALWEELRPIVIGATQELVP